MARFNSIRARMTLAFTLALAVFLLLSCTALIVYARHDAERNAERLLDVGAEKVRHELSDREGPEGLSEMIEEERDLVGNNLALVLFDPQGHVLKKSQSQVPGWPARSDDAWKIRRIPAGAAIMVIGYPWGTTKSGLDRQAKVLEALCLLALLCACPGAWLLVGRTLSPISQLTQQVQSASIRNLEVHIAAPSLDAEIVGLVQTLNGLLNRVTETAAARGRFYAAASHELRTPLQALSGHLELALRRPRTLEAYLAVIEEAHAQTGRLTLLVRDLLLLTQVESGSLPLRETLDVSELCRRSLEHFAPTLTSRRLDSECEFRDASFVLAAPMHLQMVIRNLIENAVKYADEGSTLHVEVSGASSQVQLKVLNICSDSIEWDNNRMFEPFYRPDSSRNAETGGSGLGLAICKAIVDANGWRLEVRRVSTMVQAVVTLPVP